MRSCGLAVAISGLIGVAESSVIPRKGGSRGSIVEGLGIVSVSTRKVLSFPSLIPALDLTVRLVVISSIRVGVNT